jgi:hypothetical protein
MIRGKSKDEDQLQTSLKVKMGTISTVVNSVLTGKLNMKISVFPTPNTHHPTKLSPSLSRLDVRIMEARCAEI